MFSFFMLNSMLLFFHAKMVSILTNSMLHILMFNVLVLDVTFLSGSLRFRLAKYFVRSPDIGFDETGQPEGLRIDNRHESLARHELVKTCRRGIDFIKRF